MSNEIVQTDPAALWLPELAASANAYHRMAEDCAKTAIENAFLAGDCLLKAKAQVQHGEWGQWVAKNFNGSARTAQAYMRLASNREAIEAKNADSAHLSIDGALKLLAEPGKQPAKQKPRRRTYTPHPMLDEFPMGTPGEMKALVRSIARYGLQVPIVTWGDWIMDGRRRLYACGLAGVEPRFEAREFKDEEHAIEYIFSANLYRKHLSKGEWIEAGRKLAELEARMGAEQ